MIEHRYPDPVVWTSHDPNCFKRDPLGYHSETDGFHIGCCLLIQDVSVNSLPDWILGDRDSRRRRVKCRIVIPGSSSSSLYSLRGSKGLGS